MPGGQALAHSDDPEYPVDATLMRVPAHRFMTPAVNVKKPVRVAIVKYVRPAPNEEIVPASVKALEQYFGEDRVRVSHLSLKELAHAIKRGEVDVFLSSAGFYRRLADEGVKALVSAVSVAYPDPNHGDGTAIVTAAGARTSMNSGISGTRCSPPRRPRPSRGCSCPTAR